MGSYWVAPGAASILSWFVGCVDVLWLLEVSKLDRKVAISWSACSDFELDVLGSRDESVFWVPGMGWVDESAALGDCALGCDAGPGCALPNDHQTILSDQPYCWVKSSRCRFKRI